MPVTRVACPSRFAIWKTLENAIDRYASYAALAVGVLAASVGVFLH